MSAGLSEMMEARLVRWHLEGDGTEFRFFSKYERKPLNA